MENRINWVDYAKGAGIILVVYGHVIRGLQQNLPESFYFISDTLVYGFHMPLFFFLSGLFAEKWSKRDYKTAIKQKVKMLAYPYFLWSFIQCSFNIIFSSYTNTKMNVGDYFRILYKPIGQFWFLYVIFLMYLAYYILRKFFNIRHVLLISILMFLFSPFVKIWILGAFFSKFIFFVIGSFLMSEYDFEHKIKIFAKSEIICLTCTSFLVWNYIYIGTFYKFTLFEDAIMDFFIALLGILLCLCLSVFLSTRNMAKSLKYIGTLSMVIYVAHILATAGTRIIMMRFFNITNIGEIAFSAMVLGVALPIMICEISKKLGLSLILFGNVQYKNLFPKEIFIYSKFFRHTIE